MSPLLYHISCTIQRDKKCLAEVRRAGWELTCTWHPLQGPTEMTGKTDVDRNKALMVSENKKVCDQHLRKSAQILKDREQRGWNWWRTGGTSRAFIDKYKAPKWVGFGDIICPLTQDQHSEGLGQLASPLFLRCPQSGWEQRGLTLGENSRNTLPTSTDISSTTYFACVFLNSSHSTKPPKSLNKWRLERRAGLWVDHLNPMELSRLSTSKNNPRGTCS